MKGLIENAIYVPKKKSSSFVCCKKKVLPQKINFDYNFKFQASELRRAIIHFKKHMTSSISNEEKIENNYLDNFYQFIYDYLNKKVNYLFELHNINDKLKDEVDRYWEYFNIKKIISKQTNKIKQQNNKLLILEEAHMQNDCIICMEGERSVIFKPCLHFICCETCSFGKIANDCPECHTKIEHKQLTLS
jgi:hypothetical protein